MKRIRSSVVSAIAGAVMAFAPAANADGPGDTPFSWTGLYVGAAVGTSWGALAETNHLGETDSHPIALSEGALAVGYDFRLGSALVAGVFADYAFGGVSDHGTVDNRWALGDRLGVLATQSALIYASAGYTTADSHFDVPHKLSGYFVGAGIEYLVAPNLSLKVDYRFSDHDAFEVDFGGGNPITLDADLHSFRLGVNWRFGMLK